MHENEITKEIIGAAIEVLRSWVDFSVNGHENKEIEETIRFLENILKYSYGEILEKLK
jgi:hypothetical protein